MLLKRRLIGQRIRYAGLGLAVPILVLGVSSLNAQGASSIAQGFQSSDPNVVAGALVSLKQGTPNTVELGTQDNVDRLLGVVGNKSVIELTNGRESVQVVTNGSTTVLVSDINGAIKTGDKVTTSPISGIGMKATTSTIVIGTAQAGFSSTSIVQTRTVTDKKGKELSVHIGAIPIQVDKVFYQAPQDDNSFLPPVLQDFASSVAGHEVSPVRVLVAALLVLMLFVVVTILVYSSVRSSIISIGRNPLSEEAVQKSLLEIGLTVVGILVFTVIVIYLILTT